MRMGLRQAIVVGAAAACALGSAAAAQSPPPGKAKAGRALYLRFGCHACHGTSGQGAGVYGPKIAPDPLPFFLVTAALRSPRARMPVYTSNVLTDVQIAEIYAYLTSIPPGKSHEDIPLLNRN